MSAGRHHRFLRYHSTVLIASKYELSSARPSADLSHFAPRVISVHIIILHFAFVVGELFAITEQASKMAAVRVVSLGTPALPLMKTEWTGCRLCTPLAGLASRDRPSAPALRSFLRRMPVPHTPEPVSVESLRCHHGVLDSGPASGCTRRNWHSSSACLLSEIVVLTSCFSLPTWTGQKRRLLAWSR